ncbi:MAG: hypothetical protein AB7O97_06820 [Planctomycetota bacterium]
MDWLTGGLLVPVTLMAVETAAAQQTWVVDRYGRPGTDFTDLPAAVAAAQDGDTLLLRATSTTLSQAEAYEAPGLVDGKGLVIRGEDHTTPVAVYGYWDVRNLPSQSSFVVSKLTLSGLFNVNCFAWFFGPNDGPVAFDRVRVLPIAHCGSLIGPVSRFRDCDLVSLTQCQIDASDWAWAIEGSKVMMTDTTVTQTQGSIVNTHMVGTLRVTDSELWIAGGRVEGPSEYLSHHVASSPLWLCRSVVHLSAGARVIGGTTLGGFRYPPASGTCDPWPDVYYDSTVQLSLSGITRVNWIATPQVGVRTTQQGATLTIRQDFGQPSSATLLLIGAIQTPPWSAGIGPVFVDPTAVWSDLRLGPQPSLVLQSFAIPPGVPLGTQLGVQAFGWTPAGGFLASNLATIGF